MFPNTLCLGVRLKVFNYIKYDRSTTKLQTSCRVRTIFSIQWDGPGRGRGERRVVTRKSQAPYQFRRFIRYINYWDHWLSSVSVSSLQSPPSSLLSKWSPRFPPPHPPMITKVFPNVKREPQQCSNLTISRSVSQVTCTTELKVKESSNIEQDE